MAIYALYCALLPCPTALYMPTKQRLHIPSPANSDLGTKKRGCKNSPKKILSCVVSSALANECGIKPAQKQNCKYQSLPPPFLLYRYTHNSQTGGVTVKNNRMATKPAYIKNPPSRR